MAGEAVATVARPGGAGAGPLPALTPVAVAVDVAVEPLLRAASATLSAMVLRHRAATAAADQAEDAASTADRDERSANAQGLAERRAELELDLADRRRRHDQELDWVRAAAVEQLEAARRDALATVATATAELDVAVTRFERRPQRTEWSPASSSAPATGAPVERSEPVAAVAPIAAAAVPVAPHPPRTPDPVVAVPDGPAPSWASDLSSHGEVPPPTFAPATGFLAFVVPGSEGRPDSVLRLPVVTTGEGSVAPAPSPTPAAPEVAVPAPPAASASQAAALPPPPVHAAPAPPTAAIPAVVAHPAAPPSAPEASLLRRLLHLDVVLPLVAVAIVLVVLLAWVG